MCPAKMRNAAYRHCWLILTRACFIFLFFIFLRFTKINELNTNVIFLQDTLRGKKSGCVQELMASEIPTRVSEI